MMEVGDGQTHIHQYHSDAYGQGFEAVEASCTCLRPLRIPNILGTIKRRCSGVMAL